MNGKYIKSLAIIVAALMLLSTLAVFPVKAVAGAGQATIYISPADTHLLSPPYIVNSKFWIEVRCADYTHVASWQAKVAYDASMLSEVGCDYTPAADFIFSPGTYTVVPPGTGAVNATHNYVMMTAAVLVGPPEYAGSDVGLMNITFQIVSAPTPGHTLSSYFELYAPEPPLPQGGDTWTCDTMVNDNALTTHGGTYELEGFLLKPYLAFSPSAKSIPAIAGSRTEFYPSKKDFVLDIMMTTVAARDVVLAEFAVRFNASLVNVTDVGEGNFMNNPTWAPYGTFMSWNPPDSSSPGYLSGFILINTNSSTGEWDWPQRPDGTGILVSVHFTMMFDNQPNPWFQPTSPINIEGVFGEFFIDSTINYVPYDPPHNATLSYTGYDWANPHAEFIYTPGTPLVGQVVTFDASGSYGWRNTDPLVPDPTYLVSYRWDFGDGNITTITTPIITHKYAAMGLYAVTLTVTDEDGRIGTAGAVINIIFGRMIDVWTQYPDPYGGQGINKTSDAFWPQKPVILTALLTYNGDPVQHKPVVFQIISPTGKWNFTRVVFSDADGFATIMFGLPWPCDNPEADVFGIWTVVVKADIQCQTTWDWLWFKVYWLTYQLTVTPKATTVHKGQTIDFDITFVSYMEIPRWVLVTLVVYDDLNVPVGQASTWILVGKDHVWCTYDQYKLTLSVFIPKYAFVGTGKVYVNTFFNWPTLCGYALSPEASNTFGILKP